MLNKKAEEKGATAYQITEAQWLNLGMLRLNCNK